MPFTLDCYKQSDKQTQVDWDKQEEEHLKNIEECKDDLDKIKCHAQKELYSLKQIKEIPRLLSLVREASNIIPIKNECDEICKVEGKKTQEKYLKSIKVGLEKMLYQHYRHRYNCQKLHRKWQNAFDNIVPAGTRMNSEQIQYRDKLEEIQKEHLK